MNLKIQLLLISFLLAQNTAFSNEEVVDGGFSNIKKLYRNAQYSEAAAAAENMLKVSPANDEVRELLALSLFQSKDYKGVVRLFTDTQAEFLNSSLQLKLRTISLAREGHFYSALLVLRNLKEEEVLGHSWKSYYHYLVYRINKDSAYKELKRMNQVSPDAVTELIQGDLYALDGNNSKAIELYESALKKNYLNAEVLEKMGDSHCRSKDYEKAVVAYQSLIKFMPEKSSIKLKLAWAMEKGGHYLDAFKFLEKENDQELAAYREKLAVRIKNILNNPSRVVAGKEDIEPVDGRLALEEKFIPAVSLKIAEDAPVSVAANIVTAPVAIPNQDHSGDVSAFEFSLGPKAKKYSLSGNGFNAKVDYSTGMAVGAKYTFTPEERAWESMLVADYSKTSMNDLNGVTPKDVTLNELRLSVGVNYKLDSFSVGPALMYEKMSATQTTPNTIRGNVDFANVGVRANAFHAFTDKFQSRLEFNYFRKIVTTSKTTAVGNVNNRSMMLGQLKFYYGATPSLQYFAGASFASVDTSYDASEARGTTAAKEKEQDVTFPLGINYVF